jgi:two-component sensor histidine kinase
VRLECRCAAAAEVGMDQAVPCGLIISELVSNALKYAFPEGRSGRIAVELAFAPDQRMVLTVADDGVGLPAGLDPAHASTLGLHLVSALTGQLMGTLEVERGRGTAFHLTFLSQTG